MKLRFKEQRYQLEAVQAVVDCFAGQSIENKHFTLQATGKINETPAELYTTVGVRNNEIRITTSQLRQNIQAVQRRNGLREIADIEVPPTAAQVNLGLNLTLEMETGTGKTYTYLRTMYELHRAYGWSKFIIIVPSIAIREGVFKSFALTEDHFMDIYGHKLRPFVYDSKKPVDIKDFASVPHISVMIINTQAFNATGKDARRIYMELDAFQSERPIDLLAKTRPILIIDEPQSVLGEKEASKKAEVSKTMEGLGHFNPLMTLRYSATHRSVYNKVYRLDALDAFQQKLVKKIQVKGIELKGITGTEGYLYLERIDIRTDKSPQAFLGFDKRGKGSISRVKQLLGKGANLFELSNQLPAYQNHVITDIDANLGRIEINGQWLLVGEVRNQQNELDFRRIQIRECIKSHLEKEKQLFARGIKVLSLFFIDRVENYRSYDAHGNPQPGPFAKMFVEEYDKLKNNYLDLFQQQYNEYLQQHKTHQTHKGYMPTEGNYEQYLAQTVAERAHQGYFSIDKKSGRSVDPDTKRGSEDSDDISAYELIMKDKERLLSFAEPTRFIFSHSALKEGWDNPNVFQICALKDPDVASQVRRRQEVGRGMRLCVDQHGIRQDAERLGTQVHDINLLTIIAAESYEQFAKGLQEEILASVEPRPLKVEPDLFRNRKLTAADGSVYQLTKDDANLLYKRLSKQDCIDDNDKLTDLGRQMIAQNTVPLPAHLEPYRVALTALLRSVSTGETYPVEDERKTQRNTLNPTNYARQEFKDLWARISRQSVYEVRYDTPKLIRDSVTRLNADLAVPKRTYELWVGDQRDADPSLLAQQGLFQGQKVRTETIQTALETQTPYDIVGQIQARTHLTRHTVAQILRQIRQDRFRLVDQNPEAFIANSSRLINECKAQQVIDLITYHRTNQHYDSSIFETNQLTIRLEAQALQKHIYHYLQSDSAVERQFAADLEAAPEVVVYAKLPAGFKIQTPVAAYNPDWAIVFDHPHARHIYFVADTKGSDSQLDLRIVEQMKRECALKHFAAISDEPGTPREVKFGFIRNYDELRSKVFNP